MSILVIRLQNDAEHAQDLLRCARSFCPDVMTIALVSGSTPRSVNGLLGLGVQGIVDEGSEDGDVAEAAKVVRSGRTFLCATAATAIARHVSGAVAGGLGRETRGGESDSIASLSSREKQVLLLLGCGATRREVAATLHIGCNTVDSHRRRMVEKLGARNFRDLLRFATRIES